MMRETPGLSADIYYPASFTLAQLGVLVKKELRIEMRTKKTIASMVLYAAALLVVYGVCFSQLPDGTDLRGISAALLWVLVVFTQIVGLNRSFTFETEQGALRGMLVAPLSRSCIFFSKAIVSFIYLALIEIVVVPVFLVVLVGFEGMGSAWLSVCVLLVLGNIGMAGLGVFLSSMAAHTRAKEILLTLLFVPLMFPLLYVCVSATTALFLGSDAAGLLFYRACILSAAFDIIMIACACVLYDYVVE